MGVLHDVTLEGLRRLGKPTDNAFIESFDGKFRSECHRQSGCLRRFIGWPASPAGWPSDDAEFSSPQWSSVGGRFKGSENS